MLRPTCHRGAIFGVPMLVLFLLVCLLFFGIPLARRPGGSLGVWPSSGSHEVRNVTMMPLGDFITALSCWRAYLWDQLRKDNVTDNLDWVGSKYDSRDTCDGVSHWDQNHEGHVGDQAYEIANDPARLKTWLEAVPQGPDIVLFHLGTNDILAGRNTSTIIDVFGEIVHMIRATKKTTKFVIAQIIPRRALDTITDKKLNDPVRDLNAAIPGFIKSTTTAASPIRMVDCYTGFNVTDFADPVHPGNSGARKIFSSVYPEVLKAVKDAQHGI